MVFDRPLKLPSNAVNTELSPHRQNSKTIRDDMPYLHHLISHRDLLASVQPSVANFQRDLGDVELRRMRFLLR
jgi:hypothetical protein